MASETSLCLTFMKHPGQDKRSSAWSCTIPFSDLRLKAFLTLSWKQYKGVFSEHCVQGMQRISDFCQKTLGRLQTIGVQYELSA